MTYKVLLVFSKFKSAKIAITGKADEYVKMPRRNESLAHRNGSLAHRNASMLHRNKSSA